MRNRSTYSNTEEILSHFFHLSQDYLCIAGYDGYFKKLNPAFINFLGYSEEQLLATPIRDFIFHADQERTATIREKLTNGAPLLNFDNRYVTKSGDIVWLTWSSIPVESNELVYAIAKNINHIKNREEEKNAIITNLSGLNNELKRLSFTVTHDLKSPVNNLIALFDLLDTAEIKDENILSYIDLLKQSSESLRDILNDYVDTIKEKSTSISKLKQVRISKALENTLAPIKYLIQNTQTDIQTNFSEVDLLNFNSFYLQSIFLNLISNSIKYARPGVPPVIHIFSKNVANEILIMVRDNGLGFDMEKVEGKMFRLNETFHQHTDSKGVGLYLVKEYMSTYGGRVEVSSALNKGTTFTLIFPNS